MICEQASFLSPPDMMIVMVIALIVFGPKKLPEVGRQLGQAMRELKKLTSELTESIHNESDGIKSAFDSVSPYKLNSGPIDSEQKLPDHVEGYSSNSGGAMSESPLLIGHPEGSATTVGSSDASGQAQAASIPLTPVRPKAGDEVQ
jgi:TatA/E family protein of Tat protein translocase